MSEPVSPYLSVVLPIGLVEGLRYNHRLVHPGERFSFPDATMYALSELLHDLGEEADLAACGITIPAPYYAASSTKGKGKRTAAHGFYSMIVPEWFHHTWARVVNLHDGHGPTAAHRALLHHYRCVRRYYAEHEPEHLAQFPDL